MHYLTWRSLTTLGVAVAALAWLVTFVMESSGATPLPVPWSVAAVCVAAGVIALSFAWQVRQYRSGKKPGLPGLRAARTAALAQATAYVGVMVASASGGYAAALLGDWSHGPRRDVIISALVAAVAALVMVVAGVLAERWCRHGGDSDSDGDSARPEPA